MDLILLMFKVEFPNLRRALAEEALHWSIQCYDAAISLRAIRIYHILLQGNIEISTVDEIQRLHSKFFDQVATLAGLELGMSELLVVEEAAPSIKPSSPLGFRKGSLVSRLSPAALIETTPSVKETWSSLNDNKRPAKDSACEFLISILSLYCQVLSSSDEIELELLMNPTIFWMSIWYKALD